LLCELVGTFGGERTILAATDATWEASEITAWSRKSLKFNYQRGWTEQFDARRTLEEESQRAIVLGKVGTAPWLKVELRDIPLPAPLVEVRSVSVVAVQRGDGYAAEFYGPETRIEPKPTGTNGPRGSAGCRRSTWPRTRLPRRILRV